MSGIDYVHHQAFPSLISTFELKDHPCEKTVLEMIETWEKTGNHRFMKGLAVISQVTSSS